MISLLTLISILFCELICTNALLPSNIISVLFKNIEPPFDDDIVIFNYPTNSKID